MSNNYIPTNWISNQTVATAEKMNNLEKGISSAHDRLDNAPNGLDATIKVQDTQPFENNNLIWLDTSLGGDADFSVIVVKDALVQENEPTDTTKLWFDL